MIAKLNTTKIERAIRTQSSSNQTAIKDNTVGAQNTLIIKHRQTESAGVETQPSVVRSQTESTNQNRKTIKCSAQSSGINWNRNIIKRKQWFQQTNAPSNAIKCAASASASSFSFRVCFCIWVQTCTCVEGAIRWFALCLLVRL